MFRLGMSSYCLSTCTVATFVPIKDIVLTKRPPSPMGNSREISSPAQPTRGSSIYLPEKGSIQEAVSSIVTRSRLKTELSSLALAEEKMEKIHGDSAIPKICRPRVTRHEPRHHRGATYS